MNDVKRRRLPREPFYSQRLGMWVVSRHADVVAVLRGKDAFSAVADTNHMLNKLRISQQACEVMNAVVPLDTPRMATSDGSAHARIRKVVQRAFGQDCIQSFGMTIEEIAAERIDQWNTGATVDLVSDYCRPIAMSAILAYVGIPRNDIATVGKWVRGITRLFVAQLPLEDQMTCADQLLQLKEYLGRWLDRQEPREEGAIAKVGACLAAACLEQPPALTRSEAIQLVYDIISAGVDTTFMAMTWTLYHLLTVEGRWSALDPAGNHVAAHVEECLRINLAQMGLVRVAECDAHLGGVGIKTGDMLYVMHTYANRDESVFREPITFIPQRAEAGKSLTFGQGLHFCLGAPLARLEIEVAVRTLLRRHPGLRLTYGGVTTLDRGIMVTLERMEASLQ